MFAKKEKQLFRLMYLRQRNPGEHLIDDANDDETGRLLRTNLEMTEDAAREMHRQMQYHCYGLGVMIATDYRDMTEAEIDEDLPDF